MMAPMAKPPTRRTAHGATMSDRLSRLYTWLQANRVQLTDFSTDECVQREMAKLVELRNQLDALRVSNPERYLDDLAADLRNIMRRTPDARVPLRAP